MGAKALSSGTFVFKERKSRGAKALASGTFVFLQSDEFKLPSPFIGNSRGSPGNRLSWSGLPRLVFLWGASKALHGSGAKMG